MRKHAVAIFATLVSLSGCGDGVAPTATNPVVVATPTPVPTPTPSTLGKGVGCGLPVMPECGQPADTGSPGGDPPGVYGCCTKETDNPAQYRSIVSQAITKAQLENPKIFSGDTVLDRPAYQRAVAQILERDFSLCSKPGVPGDEVAIKTTNDYSEQYDIYTQFQTVFNPPAYAVTCRPARF